MALPKNAEKEILSNAIMDSLAKQHPNTKVSKMKKQTLQRIQERITELNFYIEIMAKIMVEHTPPDFEIIKYMKRLKFLYAQGDVDELTYTLFKEITEDSLKEMTESDEKKDINHSPPQKQKQQIDIFTNTGSCR